MENFQNSHSLGRRSTDGRDLGTKFVAETEKEIGSTVIERNASKPRLACSVHNLNDDDFRNMLSSASKPQYGRRLNCQGDKNSSDCQDYFVRRLSDADNKLSEEAEIILAQFRREAEENQKRLDYESEMKYELVRAFIDEESRCESFNNEENDKSYKNAVDLNLIKAQKRESTEKDSLGNNNNNNNKYANEDCIGRKAALNTSNSTLKPKETIIEIDNAYFVDEGFGNYDGDSMNFAFIDDVDTMDGDISKAFRFGPENMYNYKSQIEKSCVVYAQEGNTVQEMRPLNDADEWSVPMKNNWLPLANSDHRSDNFNCTIPQQQPATNNSNYNDNSFAYTSGQLHFHNEKHESYEISPKLFDITTHHRNGTTKKNGIIDFRGAFNLSDDQNYSNVYEKETVLRFEMDPTAVEKNDDTAAGSYKERVRRTKIHLAQKLIQSMGSNWDPKHNHQLDAVKEMTNITAIAQPHPLSQATKTLPGKKREKGKSSKEYKNVYLAESAEGYMGNLSPEEILKCIEGDTVVPKPKSSQKSQKDKSGKGVSNVSTKTTVSGPTKKKDKRQHVPEKMSKDSSSKKSEEGVDSSRKRSEISKDELISDDESQLKLAIDETDSSKATFNGTLSSFNTPTELDSTTEKLDAEEKVEDVSEKEGEAAKESEDPKKLTERDYEKRLEEKHPVKEQIEIERQIQKSKRHSDESEFIEVTRKKKAQQAAGKKGSSSSKQQTKKPSRSIMARSSLKGDSEALQGSSEQQLEFSQAESQELKDTSEVTLQLPLGDYGDYGDLSATSESGGRRGGGRKARGSSDQVKKSKGVQQSQTSGSSLQKPVLSKELIEAEIAAQPTLSSVGRGTSLPSQDVRKDPRSSRPSPNIQPARSGGAGERVVQPSTHLSLPCERTAMSSEKNVGFDPSVTRPDQDTAIAAIQPPQAVEHHAVSGTSISGSFASQEEAGTAGTYSTSTNLIRVDGKMVDLGRPPLFKAALAGIEEGLRSRMKIMWDLFIRKNGKMPISYTVFKMDMMKRKAVVVWTE